MILRTAAPLAHVPFRDARSAVPAQRGLFGAWSQLKRAECSFQAALAGRPLSTAFPISDSLLINYCFRLGGF
jgi:hypothetical protein